MSGKVFFIILPFLFIVSFKQHPPSDPANQAIQQFATADRLYNLANATAHSDSICLAAFKKTIALLDGLPRSGFSDSLRFLSYSRSGILCEVYNNFPAAIDSYLEAVKYAGTQEQKFRMYIFAGVGYYKLNNFDSASFY
jgi:hypothetical protein